MNICNQLIEKKIKLKKIKSKFIHKCKDTRTHKIKKKSTFTVNDFKHIRNTV